MRSIRTLRVALALALLAGCATPGSSDGSSGVCSEAQERSRLAFHIVDSEATTELIALRQRQPGWDPGVSGTPEFIPDGTIVVPYVVRGDDGVLYLVRYMAVLADITELGLGGEHISEVRLGSEPAHGQPTVTFILDPEGAKLFARLTGENVGGVLAILLDGEVRISATIVEVSPGGEITIRTFTLKQAEDLVAIIHAADGRRE